MVFGDKIESPIHAFHPKTEAQQRAEQEATGVKPENVKILSSEEQFRNYIPEIVAQKETEEAQIKEDNAEPTLNREEITRKIQSEFPEYHPDEKKMDELQKHRDEAREALAIATYRTLMDEETEMLKGLGVEFSRQDHTLLAYACYGSPENSELRQYATAYLAQARAAEKERARMQAELTAKLEAARTQVWEDARKAQYEKSTQEGKPAPEAEKAAMEAADAALAKEESRLQEENKLRTEQANEDFKKNWGDSLQSGKVILLRDSKEHLIANIPAFEKKLSQVMRDGTLVQEWPTVGVALACYGESQTFGHRELTEGLISQCGALRTVMDMYANTSAGMLDLDELKKLGPDKLSTLNGRFLDDHLASFELASYSSAVSPAKDTYFSKALRDFKLQKVSDLSIQTPEGELLDRNSQELWDRLYAGKPVFVVPKEDPGVEPALVQPTDRFGGAVSFADPEKADSREIPDIPAPPAPNGFLSLLDSIISAVGRVFGADWRIPSCREYDRNAMFGKSLAETKQNLPQLTAKETVDKVKKVFANGKSEEELQIIHQNVVKAREDKAAAEKAEAEAFDRNMKTIESNVPENKALDPNYNRFYDNLLENVRLYHYKAGPVADVIGQGRLKDLYQEHEAALAKQKVKVPDNKTLDEALKRLDRRTKAEGLIQTGDNDPAYAAFRADMLTYATDSDQQLKNLEGTVKAGDLAGVYEQYRQITNAKNPIEKARTAMGNLSGIRNNLQKLHRMVPDGKAEDKAYQEFRDTLFRHAESDFERSEKLVWFDTKENIERLYHLYQAEPQTDGSRLENAMGKLETAMRAESRAKEKAKEIKSSILTDQMNRIKKGLRPEDNSDPAYEEFRNAVIDGAKHKPEVSARCAVFADTGFMETMFMLYKAHDKGNSNPQQTLQTTLDDMVSMHNTKKVEAGVQAEKTRTADAEKDVKAAQSIGRG